MDTQKLNKNIVWQLQKIDKRHRSQSLNQKACCIWLTGLSGSGKSTLAQALEIALHKMVIMFMFWMEIMCAMD